MSINIVENYDGRSKINWVGVSVLFIALFVSSGLIPATGMWLMLDSPAPAATALVVGFSMACGTLPVLVIQQLGLPIDKLPKNR